MVRVQQGWETDRRPVGVGVDFGVGVVETAAGMSVADCNCTVDSWGDTAPVVANIHHDNGTR